VVLPQDVTTGRRCRPSEQRQQPMAVGTLQSRSARRPRRTPVVALGATALATAAVTVARAAVAFTAPGLWPLGGSFPLMGCWRAGHWGAHCASGRTCARLRAGPAEDAELVNNDDVLVDGLKSSIDNLLLMLSEDNNNKTVLVMAREASVQPVQQLEQQQQSFPVQRADAAPLAVPPEPSEQQLGQRPQVHGIIPQADVGESQLADRSQLIADMDALGLTPAPEYGPGSRVITPEQFGRVKNMFEAKLNAFKRYTRSLEEELDIKEEQIISMQSTLTEEQRKRQAAERERDHLLQRRKDLEAQVIQDTRQRTVREIEVEDMDRRAEELAEKLMRGEITEQEATLAEESLLRAQAKRLTARSAQARSEEELRQNSVQVEGAELQLAQAKERADELSAELELVKRGIEEGQLERQRWEAECKKYRSYSEELEGYVESRDAELERMQMVTAELQEAKETSDARFEGLMSRIKAKAAGKREGST